LGRRGGSVKMPLGRFKFGIDNIPFNIPIQNIIIFCKLPASLSVSNGTLNVISNTNYSTIPACAFNGVTSINIESGATLTIDVSATLPTGITTVSGAGTLSISSGYTLTIGAKSTFSVSTVSGAGTLSISSGYTLTFSGSNLLPGTLTVNGTLALSGNYTLVTNITNGTGNLVINSGYTLTVASSLTLGFTSVGGSGTLSISSGYTLTIGANTTFSVSTVSGSGTLSINSGYTLTISANTTFSVSTVSGAGALSISSGYTLTQGGAITISVANVTVAGTWANAGYGITIPSGSTVVWYTTGSLTTASTAGTLTVNGTCYYYDAGITVQTSNAMPAFILTLAGTGIFMGCLRKIQGAATASIALSATAISANSEDGSATASGYVPYFSLSSITGSATGKYGLGIYDSTAATYVIFVLIYIGTANTAFSVSSSQYMNYIATDTSGHTIYVYNASGSAGTLTLTGTAYVWLIW